MKILYLFFCLFGFMPVSQAQSSNYDARYFNGTFINEKLDQFTVAVNTQTESLILSDHQTKQTYSISLKENIETDLPLNIFTHPAYVSFVRKISVKTVRAAGNFIDLEFKVLNQVPKYPEMELVANAQIHGHTKSISYVLGGWKVFDDRQSEARSAFIAGINAMLSIFPMQYVFETLSSVH